MTNLNTIQDVIDFLNSNDPQSVLELSTLKIFKQVTPNSYNVKSITQVINVSDDLYINNYKFFNRFTEEANIHKFSSFEIKTKLDMLSDEFSDIDKVSLFLKFKDTPNFKTLHL